MNLIVKDKNGEKNAEDFLSGGLPSYEEQRCVVRHHNAKELAPSMKVAGSLKENLKGKTSTSGFSVVGNQPDVSIATLQESQSTQSSGSYLPSYDEQCREVMRRNQKKLVRTDSMRKVGKLADKLKAFERKDQRTSNERASAPVSKLQLNFDRRGTNHRWSASLSPLEFSNKMKTLKKKEQNSSNIQAPLEALNSLLVRTPSMELAGSIKDKLKVFGMGSKTLGSADENLPKEQFRQPINQNNPFSAQKDMVQIPDGEAIEEIYCGTKYMGGRHSCTDISLKREGMQRRSMDFVKTNFMPQAEKVSDKVKAFLSKDEINCFTKPKVCIGRRHSCIGMQSTEQREDMRHRSNDFEKIDSMLQAGKVSDKVKAFQSSDTIYCSKPEVRMGRQHSCISMQSSKQKEEKGRRSKNFEKTDSMLQAGGVSDKVKAFQSKDEWSLSNITQNSDGNTSFHYHREVLVVESYDDQEVDEEGLQRVDKHGSVNPPMRLF